MPRKPEKSGAEQGSGRFRAGVSGNPRGKPKGARNHATLAVLALLEGDAEALTRKAVDKALEGDTTALRLCLERLAPPAKSRPVMFDLPTVEKTADVSAALGALVAAVAGGTLTPDEGEAIAGLLERQRRAIETEELERRIAALESKEVRK